MTDNGPSQNKNAKRKVQAPTATEAASARSHYAPTASGATERQVGSVVKIIIAATVAAIATIIAFEIYFLFFVGPVGASAHRDQAENGFYVKSEPIQGDPNDTSD